MKLREYGQYALVAGASEGIGAAFARYFADAGMDLILVARKKDKLEAFADTLRESCHVDVQVLIQDLSEQGTTASIYEAVRGKEIGVLVYNAGLSYIGPYEKNTPEHHNEIVMTNVVTPLNVVQTFGTDMLTRGRGAIVLMASLAGFQGTPYIAAYAATKAFDQVLAEGLWYEWKDRGVDVISCVAGSTATPNFLNTKPRKTGSFVPKVQAPEEVVRECVEKLGTTPSFICGTSNKLASFFMRKIFPRKLAVKIMGDTTRKMYAHWISK